MRLETYLKLNKLKQREFAKIKIIKIIEKATKGQVTWIDLIEHRVK